MTRKKMQIAVLDAETDPFLFGRVPKPFCCQFYSDTQTAVFWGDDCMEQFVDWAEQQPTRYMIYAHNGGKFDFHFMLKWLDNPVKVIKSRIVSAALFQHTLRDSFAILPMPLRDYAKDKFDYTKLERDKREKYKADILQYLHSDCVYLFELVSKFVDQFGVQLTIGSTAMKQVKLRYDFTPLDQTTDALFRRFYYGGRVQTFKHGILKGPWQYVDLNSSYPNAMKNYQHPVNGAFDVVDKRPRSFKKPYFLRFIGSNQNALPSKCEDGSLGFTKEHGEFFACSHELEVALDHGLVTIDKVLECYVATETINFATYVDDFFAQKVAAEHAGDKAGRLFAKFLLNNAYGKFGQNPDNFLDYLIVRDFGNDFEWEAQGYALDTEFDEFELWSRPAAVIESGLYDVSIAASITSASRAVLLDGLQKAVDPIYCDTDSIICKSFGGEISETALGAWKVEATAQYAAIADKKMYALYDDAKGKPTKLASKGGTLQLKDMLSLCRGNIVTYQNQAPTFSLKKPAGFITRNFKSSHAIDINENLDDGLHAV